MSAKHTPGVWSIHTMTDENLTDCTNYGFMAMSVYIGAGDKIVCQANAYIPTSDKPIDGYPHTDTAEECAANARLICAAHDLLAALQAIAEGFDIHESHSTFTRADAVNIARSAINKATS